MRAISERIAPDRLSGCGGGAGSLDVALSSACCAICLVRSPSAILGLTLLRRFCYWLLSLRLLDHVGFDRRRLCHYGRLMPREYGPRAWRLLGERDLAFAAIAAPPAFFTQMVVARVLGASHADSAGFLATTATG